MVNLACWIQIILWNKENQTQEGIWLSSQISKWKQLIIFIDRDRTPSGTKIFGNLLIKLSLSTDEDLSKEYNVYRKDNIAFVLFYS